MTPGLFYKNYSLHTNMVEPQRDDILIELLHALPIKLRRCETVCVDCFVPRNDV